MIVGAASDACGRVGTRVRSINRRQSGILHTRTHTPAFAHVDPIPSHSIGLMTIPIAIEQTQPLPHPNRQQETPNPPPAQSARRPPPAAPPPSPVPPESTPRSGPSFPLLGFMLLVCPVCWLSVVWLAAKRAAPLRRFGVSPSPAQSNKLWLPVRSIIYFNKAARQQRVVLLLLQPAASIDFALL